MVALTPAQQTLATAMTEAEFEDAIIDLATRLGWRIHAERPGRSEKGWRTAIKGMAGYPDLTLVRGGRLVFAELKSERGRLSEEQNAWIDALVRVAEASKDDLMDVFVWRPTNWLNGTIEAVLRA